MKANRDSAVIDSEKLLTSSAIQLAAWIRSGEVSSREVVQAHVDHAQRVNPVLNAIVRDRYAQALEEADTADQRLRACRGSARSLAKLPPFHGVPCSIKENFACEGMPQASGMVARRDIISEQDAPTVARIKAAGGIVIGVTNTPELCMWMETSNRVYGRSRNPYDERHIVGGSSGGEGAIIGSGAAPFGLGADVGGSIRMPAFFNGVFGHKPSPGVVPNTGQVPLPKGKTNQYCTTGPLARRAEDLMPLLRLLSGPDGQDPDCLKPTKFGDPAAVDLASLRVLQVPGNGRIRVSRELVAAQESAASGLAALGASIRRPTLKHLHWSFEIWAARMGESGVDPFAVQLGQGREISTFAELGKWALGRSDHTLPALGLAALEKLPMPKRFLKLGDELRSQLLDELGDNGVMLYPVYSRPAPRHNVPLLLTTHWVYSGIVNAMAFPATSVPMGLSRKGLPLGLQVISAPGNDHLCIAVAQELERQFGGWVPPWSASD